MENTQVDAFGSSFNVTMRILRESNEEEWRTKYNYTGPLPIDILRREPKYYEVVALD